MSATGGGPVHVSAVGGTRTVPAPDDIASDYLALALRLDQRIPGLVDGYLGPANLKAMVDMEQHRAPARLREDAIDLRARVATDVADADRRAWLDAQLVAMEAHAAELAGDGLPYLEHVERCMGTAPRRYPDARFDAARDAVDALLPGDGSLATRLEAHDAALTVAVDRLPAAAAWLVARFREQARDVVGIPDDEDLVVRLVSDKPWGGYNWYDGGRRSRVDINTDLPVRAPGLVHLVAHETYPGHHLEHAWKEAELVDRLGRLEASVLLINTPESMVSEGLADAGSRFVAPDADLVDLLVDLFGVAGLPIAADPAKSRAMAELSAALAGPRRVLPAARGNAALMRHAEGLPAKDVLAYLRDVAAYDASSAAKRMEFIEHPLWRTYVFVYADGEAMVGEWLDAVPQAEQPARFGRLLREQLTPATILAASAPG